MLDFISAYWGSALVLSVLAAVCVLIVISIRKNKKKGKSSCGGGCAGCAMSGHCGGAKAQDR